MRLPHRWNTKLSLYDKDFVLPMFYEISPVDSPSVLGSPQSTLYLCIAGELSALGRQIVVNEDLALCLNLPSACFADRTRHLSHVHRETLQWRKEGIHCQLIGACSRFYGSKRCR